MSISLITSISQGGGYNVQEESYEELCSEAKTGDNSQDKTRSLLILRPLQDIGMKECAAYAWWNKIEVAGKESLPGMTGKSTNKRMPPDRHRGYQDNIGVVGSYQTSILLQIVVGLFSFPSLRW